MQLDLTRYKINQFISEGGIHGGTLIVIKILGKRLICLENFVLRHQWEDRYKMDRPM